MSSSILIIMSRIHFFLSTFVDFASSFSANFTSRFFKDDFLIAAFNTIASLVSEVGKDLVVTFEC